MLVLFLHFRSILPISLQSKFQHLFYHLGLAYSIYFVLKLVQYTLTFLLELICPMGLKQHCFLFLLPLKLVQILYLIHILNQKTFHLSSYYYNLILSHYFQLHRLNLIPLKFLQKIKMQDWILYLQFYPPMLLFLQLLRIEQLLLLLIFYMQVLLHQNQLFCSFFSLYFLILFLILTVLIDVHHTMQYSHQF